MAQGKLHTYISELHLQERIQGLKIAIYEQGASEHERAGDKPRNPAPTGTSTESRTLYIYIYRYIYRIPHTASTKSHKTPTNRGQETKGNNRCIYNYIRGAGRRPQTARRPRKHTYQRLHQMANTTNHTSPATNMARGRHELT